MVRTLTGTCRVAALLAAGSLILWGEGTQTASVAGRVMDRDGLPLQGVIIQLRSTSLQGERRVPTDAKGRFHAPLLPPGDYTLEVSKEGYRTLSLKQRLGLGQTFQPRLTLSPEEELALEVAAAPPAIDKTEVKTATNYRMADMDQLPVERSMEQLALLTPGVTKGVGGGVQMRGAMTSANRILVDGQNVEDGAYGDRGVSLIEGAVEEVQVLTGALSAEYGGADGGVIHALTPSGSNTFTGEVRWNLWNPAWNAVGPKVNPAGIDDRFATDTTFKLGGYLLKDRLWFHTAYFTENWREVRTIGSDAFSDPAWPGGAGASYTYTRDEVRKQLKLTWLVNPEHTVVGSYLGSSTRYARRDYFAGSLDALTPQRNEDEVLSLSWRAIWSPRFLTDIRYGLKRQTVQPGTTDGSTAISDSPLWDANTGYFYNHAPFDGADGGDHRDNRTFAAKGSFFTDSHHLDAGVDWYEGLRRAPGSPTATGYIFNVTDVDPVAQTATPVSVSVYTTGGGEGRVENRALYLNDTWTPDDRWAVQLGLRWEQISGENEAGARLVRSDAFSPRVGLKYDVRGDSVWILGASYARYVSKLLDQILMKGTLQSNPMVLDFSAIDTTPGQGYTDIFDLTNYDYSTGGVTYANLPGVNIRVDPHLKAPTVDEAQASVAYSFRDTALGTGYVRATAVYKDWRDLVDYRIGNDGQGTYEIPQSGETLHPYVYHWSNNSDATRTYRALELEASTTKERWRFQGSLTWSRLWGNYEGEDGYVPGRGEGIHAWDVTDGVRMFDRNLTAPEGYLAGHVPFRARLMATYRLSSRLGETDLGLLYRFDGASRESETRYISGDLLNPALPGEAQATWFTQYKGNRRGTHRGYASWYLDLSVNHEWHLLRARATPVRAFFKAVVTNVLNHKQLLRKPRRYEDATTSPDDPWVPAANDGMPGPDCYGEPRAYRFALGLRF